MGPRDERRALWDDDQEPVPEREPTIGEVIERAAGRVTTGLVIAGAVIGLAVWARPSPPRYDAVVSGDGHVIRIDTRSGSMISCDGGYCLSILRKGQHLDRAPTSRPAPATPAPALAPPRPAAAPTAPAAQAAPAATPAR